ncbi:MAG: hypothetical protein MTP17_00375 [Candidatus Midichloria sp.]|nr:MAG: hypothetical protein MTP17_00375 [Candidatus Midichloria sp.]
MDKLKTKKDNTVVGIQDISIEFGLNRFFDIKEKYSSKDQIEYYLFQEDKLKSLKIKIELFNQSLFGEPTVRYFLQEQREGSKKNKNNSLRREKYLK